MKKIFIYILCLMAAGMTACESMLDLEPKSGVTFDHFFRDENDLEALLRQMNADLRTRYTVPTFHDHMGVKADRVYDASEFEKIRSRDISYIASVNSQLQWKGWYNVLSLVDLFLDNCGKATGVSEERQEFYRGQCNFIRAICYFNLTRTWGDAVITKGSTYVAPYAKSPATEVLDTAIASAERAYRLLPLHEKLRNADKKELTSRQYGSKGNAAALLAHMYAWKGAIYNDNEAFTAAVGWADLLLEPAHADEVGNTYAMLTTAEAVATDMSRNSSEGIFEIEINYTDNSYYGHFFPGSYFVSWPVLRNKGEGDVVERNYGLLATTVNAMYEPGDERRTSWFFEPDVTERNAAGLAYLYKWRKPMYESAGTEIFFIGMDCNRVIYRMADICLLRAECLARLGQKDKAIADLNRIRSLRGANLFPNGRGDFGGNDLQWSIFLEREKELLFEGHRYYDAIRNGYYGKSNPHKGVLAAAFDNLTADEIRSGALYLPIPESAFRDNDLMIQNTYWLSKMK